MSYVTSLYHIVFATKQRQAVLTETYTDQLYRVMASIIKKKESKALIINGIENHIHILLSLSPNVSLADIMRDLKSQSSTWAKKCGFFPMFDGWAHEYGAFSLSASHRQAVYDYILRQPLHHKDKDLESEFQRLVMKNGLTFYPWPTV